MINLEEIEQRATLRRWPTQAELGQLQGDNKDLIKHIRELQTQLQRETYTEEEQSHPTQEQPTTTDGWTSHGHPIPDKTQHWPRPPIARCGGPKICTQCAKETNLVPGTLTSPLTHPRTINNNNHAQNQTFKKLLKKISNNN